MDDDLRALERMALAGHGPDAYVLASHRADGYAGVWVRTSESSEQGDEVVIAVRDAGGWSELSSGSACSTRAAFREPAPDDQGVLVMLGMLDGPGTVRVDCGSTTVRSAAPNGHWLATFVGVTPEAIDQVVIRSEAETAGWDHHGNA